MLAVFCRRCQRLHGCSAAHLPDQKRHLVLAEAGLSAARSNRFLDLPRKVAHRAVEQLAVGGTTPLALGLTEAHRLARRQRRRQPLQPIWLVLLTDGRANVALRTGDPWSDALAAARALKVEGLHGMVIDTETAWPRFGRAAELAAAMNTGCIRLEDVLGRPVSAGRREAV